MNQKINIKQLTETDVALFKELIILFQEVFEHENDYIPSDQYLKQLLSKTDFMVYIISLNNKVAGGLTAYELKKYYIEESEFFIYDIAVAPIHQRNGLGKQLLTSLKQYASNQGIREIFVAAHQEDQHALDFYTVTGGNAEKVVHFNYHI